MKVKQIIVTARCPGTSGARAVFNSSRECIAGNEGAVKEISAKTGCQITIVVRGEKGETTRAVFNDKGECVAGDPKIASYYEDADQGGAAEDDAGTETETEDESDSGGNDSDDSDDGDDSWDEVTDA